MFKKYYRNTQIGLDTKSKYNKLVASNVHNSLKNGTKNFYQSIYFTVLFDKSLFSGFSTKTQKHRKKKF